MMIRRRLSFPRRSVAFKIGTFLITRFRCRLYDYHTICTIENVPELEQYITTWLSNAGFVLSFCISKRDPKYIYMCLQYT